MTFSGIEEHFGDDSAIIQENYSMQKLLNSLGLYFIIFFVTTSFSNGLHTVIHALRNKIFVIV